MQHRPESRSEQAFSGGLLQALSVSGLMSPVWLHRVNDVPLDGVEWWRVVAVEGTCGSRLVFIAEQLAESFARFLLADCCQTVLLERWREGERTDVRFVAPVPGAR